MMDLFVMPTISFRLLYGLLILRHDRRHIYGWQLPRTRPLKGSPASWLRPVAGSRLHDTLSVIEIAFTAKYSSGVSARWASEIDRYRRGHRGKMDTRNVSSARSEGNALTMSWCLGNDTFVTCCCRT